MPNMFLVRPSLIPGESLSSWRQRVGWANGYHLFPIEDGRLRRSDPDAGTNISEFLWIADRHGCEPKNLEMLTLRGLIGIAIADLQSRHHPAWWLRSRYGPRAHSFGGMYCPRCLQEDAIPHFRLAWRLAFNYACPNHFVQYRDSCQKCGSPPWPAGGAIQHPPASPRFKNLANCWRCGDWLGSHTCVASHEIDEAGAWLESLHVQLGTSSVPPLEAFAALRAICQLFVRGASRTRILQSSTAWAEQLEAGNFNPSGHAVEHLSVNERRLLVPMALRLLNDWPASFVSFCTQCKISRRHFSMARGLQPTWMGEVIDTELALQNRWVGERDVRAQVRLIRAAGVPVTKKEIFKRLRWEGHIPADWLNGAGDK